MRSGFINFGNVCFLNSTIQLLCSMDEFLIFLNKYYPDFYNGYIQNKGPISCLDFFRDYKKLNTSYESGQEDVVTCLTFFLDHLRDRGEKSFLINLNQTVKFKNKAEKSKSEITENIMCVKFDRSLVNCINDYFYENNNEFAKKYQFKDHSKYLIVSIKRFTSYNGRSRKITDKIDASFSFKIDEAVYNLIGFIVHDGKIEGGHYYYCGLTDENWYMYNDNNVYPISDDRISSIASNGYVFLYKMESLI